VIELYNVYCTFYVLCSLLYMQAFSKLLSGVYSALSFTKAVFTLLLALIVSLRQLGPSSFSIRPGRSLE